MITQEPRAHDRLSPSGSGAGMVAVVIGAIVLAIFLWAVVFTDSGESTATTTPATVTTQAGGPG